MTHIVEIAHWKVFPLERFSSEYTQCTTIQGYTTRWLNKLYCALRDTDAVHGLFLQEFNRQIEIAVAETAVYILCDAAAARTKKSIQDIWKSVRFCEYSIKLDDLIMSVIYELFNTRHMDPKHDWFSWAVDGAITRVLENVRWIFYDTREKNYVIDIVEPGLGLCSIVTKQLVKEITSDNIDCRDQRVIYRMCETCECLSPLLKRPDCLYGIRPYNTISNDIYQLRIKMDPDLKIIDHWDGSVPTVDNQAIKNAISEVVVEMKKFCKRYRMDDTIDAVIDNSLFIVGRNLNGHNLKDPILWDCIQHILIDMENHPFLNTWDKPWVFYSYQKMDFSYDPNWSSSDWYKAALAITSRNGEQEHIADIKIRLAPDSSDDLRSNIVDTIVNNRYIHSVTIIPEQKTIT